METSETRIPAKALNCISCNNELLPGGMFCPHCGARVISRRLTILGLIQELFSNIFNLETGFLRTLIDLTVRPEKVTVGFIEGVRKKYLRPGSYLALSLTLSGALVYFIIKAKDRINFDAMVAEGQSSEGMMKAFEATMDYQALLNASYIPMGAIASFMCFPDRRYNFAERSVIFTYGIAHYSIIIFLPTILLLIYAPEAYMTASLYALALLYFGFGFYVYRASGLGMIELIGRLTVFYAIMLVLFFGLSIGINVILLLTGVLDIQDFVPKNPG